MLIAIWKRIKNLILDPYPLRTMVIKLIKKFEIGTYEERIMLGAVDRPHYGYCVYNAVILAKKLGYQRISILEFGVAMGDGLANLECHTQEISKLFDIEIDIYGFDSCQGLPSPVDYRDLPYQWEKGFYKMNASELQAKFQSTKLVLGDIKDTTKDFFEKYNPAPIGAILYDLDFYSSTIIALNMLEDSEKYCLPRIFCYFDDIIGTEVELHNDFIGERLAINEFNLKHMNIKFGPAYYLLAKKVVEEWFHKIWICHFFKHDRYNDFININEKNILNKLEKERNCD